MRMVGKRNRNGRDGWERAGCMCPPQEGGCATVSLLNTSLVFLFFYIIGFRGREMYGHPQPISPPFLPFFFGYEHKNLYERECLL